jgi:hypothetical protein
MPGVAIDATRPGEGKSDGATIRASACGDPRRCIKSQFRPRIFYDSIKRRVSAVRLLPSASTGGEDKENGHDADAGSWGFFDARGIVAGAASGGTRSARWCNHRWDPRRHCWRRARPRRWCFCGGRDRRHDWRGHRCGSPTERGRILLVARRLLLPLSERRMASSTARLLLLLSRGRCGFGGFSRRRRPPTW